MTIIEKRFCHAIIIMKIDGKILESIQNPPIVSDILNSFRIKALKTHNFPHFKFDPEAVKECIQNFTKINNGLEIL